MLALISQSLARGPLLRPAAVPLLHCLQRVLASTAASQAPPAGGDLEPGQHPRLSRQGGFDFAAAGGAAAVAVRTPDQVPEVVGSVDSIESFSAVDGPGVRFLVFLQGCGLRCVFCSNPDTWHMARGERGLEPLGRVGAARVKINCNPPHHAQCQLPPNRPELLSPAPTCPLPPPPPPNINSHFTFTGNLTSSKDLAKKLERVKPYLSQGQHQGGITLSGGEPLLQPEFTAALLMEAHARGLTTCIDTTGQGTKHAHWDKVLPHLDYALFCIKSPIPGGWVLRMQLHAAGRWGLVLLL